ncbi:MAG: EthD family reductase [Pseudonocardiaceae bacterium]
MVKLVVLYGQPTSSGDFEAYYGESHDPLVDKIPGLRRKEYARATGAPGGGEPAYYRIAELYFDNRQDLEAGTGSPEGQAAVQDLGNFATGGVTIFIADVDE